MSKQVHCEVIAGSPDAVHNMTNDFLEENEITRDELVDVLQSIRPSTGEIAVTIFFESNDETK